MIRAFNRDTPFPRFVLEQLAGDAVAAGQGTADWLTLAATGFLVGGTHDIVGNQTIEGMLQQRADDLDDMITATGTAFLGLTSSAPGATTTSSTRSRQADYYGFQAIFAGVNHAMRDVPAPDSGGPPDRGRGGRRRAGANRPAAGRVRAAGARPTAASRLVRWSTRAGMSSGSRPYGPGWSA